MDSNNSGEGGFDPARFADELERMMRKSKLQEQENFVAPIVTDILKMVAEAAKRATKGADGGAGV